MPQVYNIPFRYYNVRELDYLQLTFVVAMELQLPRNLDDPQSHH
jgi:hypothetical protein